MDRGELTEALYLLPREEFTSARDEQVKAARAAGDKELAATLGKLRRPTLAAWLVNRLSRERPETLAALAELGEALRTAHHNLDGAALRQLSQQRQAAVGGLVAAVRELGRDAGQPVSDTVVRELEEMFTAALGSPDAARALASGRVTATRDVADPNALDWPDTDPSARPTLAAVPDRPPASRPSEIRPATSRADPSGPDGSRTPAESGPGPDPALARARIKAQAELDRLTEARTRAESAADETAGIQDAAAGAEQAAHRRVAELRTELTAAEQEEKRSRDVARAARRAREDADRALKEARRREEIAAQRLSGLGEHG